MPVSARIQPQGRSRPSNLPINKALAFLWNAAQPDRELLTGVVRATDNTAKAAAPVGKVISASAGQVNIEWSRQFITTSSGDGLGDFTLAVYANPIAGGSLEALFCQKNDAGGAPYAQAGIYANTDAAGAASNGTVSFFTYNNTASSTGVQASGQLDGKYHWWVATRRGAVYSLYRDGVLLSNTSVGNGSAQQITQSSPPRYMAIGGQGNTTSGAYTRQAATAAGWNRALSASEIAAMGANPWQLFDAPAPTLYLVSASTGNATASPTGVSASSAVGGATVTGQATAAPSGVSATAAVGTATASGSTVINGTASPAGVAATAAVGTATASGAASSTAQPAGVSAAAAVGAAIASGQGKAAPSGVSATAAVGTANATGQAITMAYPSGVSAVASVGSATVSGTATVAPLGVQSQIYVGTPYAFGPYVVPPPQEYFLTTISDAPLYLLTTISDEPLYLRGEMGQGGNYG